MAKGKEKPKHHVTIFEQRRRERMDELESTRSQKTTRKTLPKLEKAFGITSLAPIPPVTDVVPAGVGAPVDGVREPTGMGRRKTRRRKTTKRRK
jgi:hypothetical protein